MSTNKDEKIDTVVAMLTEALTDSAVLEKDSLAEVYKYMLYANPNGSGMINLKQGKEMDLGTKQMISSVLNDPEDKIHYHALPTNSVAIHIRMRHTISELLKKYEILSFMKAHIYHRIAKGEEGKLTYTVGTETKVVGPAQLSSIRASIKEAMVTHLPAVVDDCYSIKYGAASNFTYSLVDVKGIKVLQDYIDASLKWIQSHVTENLTVKSEMKKIDDWYKYTKNSRSHISKYGDHLVKLFKTICARAGRYRNIKLAQMKDEDCFEQKSKEQSIVHYSQIIGSLDVFVRQYMSIMEQKTAVALGNTFNEQLDSGEHQVINDNELKTNKKYYQNILFKALLSHVRSIAYNYGVVPSDDKAFQAIMHGQGFVQYYQYLTRFINQMLEYAFNLNVNMAVVFGDTFENGPVSFDDCVKELMMNKSSTNARVLNALYKFFSVASQVDDLKNRRPISSRKSLPDAVDRLIAGLLSSHPDKKRECDESLAKDRESGKDLAPLKLAHYGSNGANGAKSGYLQTGVMIIKSLIVEDTSKVLVYPKSHVANSLDHWADCYEAIYIDAIEESKSNKAQSADFSSLRNTNVSSPSQMSPGVKVQTFEPSHTAFEYKPELSFNPVVEQKTPSAFELPSEFGGQTSFASPSSFAAPTAFGSPSSKSLPVSFNPTGSPGLKNAFNAGVGSGESKVAPSVFGGAPNQLFGGFSTPPNSK